MLLMQVITHRITVLSQAGPIFWIHLKPYCAFAIFLAYIHSITMAHPFFIFRELADLLGQVKPPTATKEDIDKSGLAIIKASELSQHEKDGKVSSNCLDRVCSASDSRICTKLMIS